MKSKSSYVYFILMPVLQIMWYLCDVASNTHDEILWMDVRILPGIPVINALVELAADSGFMNENSLWV